MLFKIYVNENVFGEPLNLAVKAQLLAFRDGFCKTNRLIFKHIICAVVDDEFLAFSKSKGNDLISPQKQYFFPGLKSGDRWCLCVLRWKEALEAGCAPKVELESTNEAALEYVSIDDLIKNAVKK